MNDLMIFPFRNFLIFLFFLLLFMANIHACIYELKDHQLCTSLTFCLLIARGQPIISAVQSPGIRNSHGFWYHFRDVLISQDVTVELDQGSCTLYPNPVSGEAVLEVAGALPGNLRIELLDITGKIHRVWDKVVDDPNIYKIVLDLTTVPQGSYMLRVSANRNQWNSKLIKQN